MKRAATESQSGAFFPSACKSSEVAAHGGETFIKEIRMRALKHRDIPLAVRLTQTNSARNAIFMLGCYPFPYD